MYMAFPTEKIDLIPHGVPDFPFTDPNYFKDLFDTQGKSVLLTFGCCRPTKESKMSSALCRRFLHKHPNLVYIVSGATHPHIRRREGERYREELQAAGHGMSGFRPTSSSTTAL